MSMGEGSLRFMGVRTGLGLLNERAGLGMAERFVVGTSIGATGFVGVVARD